MTEQERLECRRLSKKREMLKDPVLKNAYECAQKRAQENEARMQALNAWGKNGYAPSATSNPQPRMKTESEKRREDLVRNFG